VQGSDAAAIDERSSLADLGLDSLMAFELKVKIERELGIELSADRLGSGAELVHVAQLLVAQWQEGAGIGTTDDLRPRRGDRAAPSHGERLRSATQTATQHLETNPLDAAALAYVADQPQGVADLTDEEMTALAAREPLVHLLCENDCVADRAIAPSTPPFGGRAAAD
jgi:acyl carrier protein